MAPPIPANMTHFPGFAWGEEVSTNVWAFTLTVTTWTSDMLNDLTALVDCSLSVVDGYLQATNTNARGNVHGFLFNQAFRLDTAAYPYRRTDGAYVITEAFVVTQLSSTSTSVSYNTNPALSSADQASGNRVEFNVNGNVTVDGWSLGMSLNTWYDCLQTYTDSSITFERPGGSSFSRTGTFTRSEATYNAFGWWYNNGDDAQSIAQWGAMTITGVIYGEDEETGNTGTVAASFNAPSASVAATLGNVCNATKQGQWQMRTDRSTRRQAALQRSTGQFLPQSTSIMKT